MTDFSTSTIQYAILDPAGNITALVESAVPVSLQPDVASRIMERHPEVEQVGFVRPGHEEADGVDLELRLAGGEFCGNAAMCAAVWAVRAKRGENGEERSERIMQQGTSDKRTQLDPGQEQDSDRGTRIGPARMHVSGTPEIIEVWLEILPDGSVAAEGRMPAAVSADRRWFAFEGTEATLPLVDMGGIAHILIDEGTAFFALQEDTERAGRAVRSWCEQLSADALGLMFLKKETDERYRMTPLVYVPGSGTLFWENACASGSAAVGTMMAKEEGRTIRIELSEPGGTVCVESDPNGKTRLFTGIRAVAFGERIAYNL